MIRLIIYINSEQKASAFRIEENTSSSISFYGNDFESDLSQFCKIVMEDLRVNSLNEMEKKRGISVLIVSNGATNENIRKLMVLFLHDENEEEMLNVNIQELNVIEAKYILPLIGNPAKPQAQDFQYLFSLGNKLFVNQNDFDELKTKNSKLMDEISLYKETQEKLRKENSDLKAFKAYYSEIMQAGTLCTIDLKNYSAMALNQQVVINILQKEGSIVTENTIIASYKILKEPPYNNQTKDFKEIAKGAIVGARLGGVVGAVVGAGVGVGVGAAKNRAEKKGEYKIINVFAKETGKIFYTKYNNETVHDGDVIAIIGKESWTKEDADLFLKNSSKL